MGLIHAIKTTSVTRHTVYIWRYSEIPGLDLTLIWEFILSLVLVFFDGWKSEYTTRNIFQTLAGRHHHHLYAFETFISPTKWAVKQHIPHERHVEFELSSSMCVRSNHSRSRSAWEEAGCSRLPASAVQYNNEFSFCSLVYSYEWLYSRYRIITRNERVSDVYLLVYIRSWNSQVQVFASCLKLMENWWPIDIVK